ncbi:hypothetical protein [Actinomycetospora sp. NBRC 106378]|uniref:hypothetical protein n=1 Tax=Actinomycetospora sp. NBRC 106378 TaxID=3032208 RepID=UPI0024A39712|nr:hypothetical protein [Actinomycetospora sp. NBRC 106378]GLZ55687.1 hypothetical protein Acsp07_53040 [Actinomycetospora sp. NBRC 106378]
MTRVEEQRPPRPVRVLAVLGVAAVGGAVGVGVSVAAYSAGLRPWRYPSLSPLVTVSYAVVGTLLAALAWRVVRRRARRPRAVLAWSVAAVAAVSFGADVLAAAEGRLLVGLLTAVQHALVIAATVAVLGWAMPVGPDDGERAVPPGWTARLREPVRVVLAVVLVAVAGIWVVVNKAVEGPTLLVLTPRHGLTVADLLSVAALVTAGHLLRTAVRARG